MKTILNSFMVIMLIIFSCTILSADTGSQAQFSWKESISWGNKIGHMKWSAKAEGLIIFNDDDSGILRMGKGARFFLERKGRDSLIRLEAFPDVDGTPFFIYKENGKEMPYNALVQEILKEGLGMMLSYFGINAETRIRRAYQRGGVAKVIDLIQGFNSDHTSVIHYSEFFMLQDTDENEIADVLMAMAEHITSDEEMATVLPFYFMNHLRKKKTWDPFLKCMYTMESDDEKARALSVGFVNPGNGLDELLVLLKAVGTIGSSFCASQVFSAIAPESIEMKAACQEFFQALAKIDSDHDKAFVILSILNHKGISDSLRSACRDASADFHSYCEYKRVNCALRD